MMVTIIDYGMGNLGSVKNMFKRIGAESVITGNIVEIEKAEKLLLPGVGAFDAAILKINESGLRPVLDKRVKENRVPILGICLGMQLLTEESEEGKEKGLGWLPAKSVKFRFPAENNLKIPHMGWNRAYEKKSSPLIKDLPDEPRFYFVHSYYVKCDNPEDVLATTIYGVEFDSIVQRENIFGAQFHPEKSHKFGMKLLENFAKI
jgi:glutamine amidotransferase